MTHDPLKPADAPVSERMFIDGPVDGKAWHGDPVVSTVRVPCIGSKGEPRSAVYDLDVDGHLHFTEYED